MVGKVKLMAVWAALALVCLAVLPVSAEVLKGGVEEENYRLHHRGVPQQGAATDGMRISRAPSALRGSAVDATAFAQPENPRSDNSGPMRGIVDDNQFAAPPRNFDIGAERGSRELTLAWEAWHKQLSQAIYTRWQRVVRDPGRATIRIEVTRDHYITARVLRSSGSTDFDDTILAAINSLNGNPGLTFPSKSERQQVSFEADYIAGTNVTPGYSWVKNDYEHIKENY